MGTKKRSEPNDALQAIDAPSVGSLIRVSEAASIMGMERQSAYRWVKLGKLPVYRIGGHLFVERSVAESLKVPPPGLQPKDNPRQREWTRAMTIKRLNEWNDAVQDGAFTKADGSVSEHKIRLFENRNGWTHEELLSAIAEWQKKEER